jgi:uncharacterized membrane protein YeaQ/YmgE (transglycosylase-associated protein family)
MDLYEFGMLSAVALVCGLIAQATNGHSRGGLLMNLFIAYLGAFLGMYLSRWADAPEIINVQFGTADFPVIYCLSGSVGMIALVGLLMKPKTR